MVERTDLWEPKSPGDHGHAMVANPTGRGDDPKVSFHHISSHLIMSHHILSCDAKVSSHHILSHLITSYLISSYLISSDLTKSLQQSYQTSSKILTNLINFTKFWTKCLCVSIAKFEFSDWYTEAKNGGKKRKKVSFIKYL